MKEGIVTKLGLLEKGTIFKVVECPEKVYAKVRASTRNVSMYSRSGIWVLCAKIIDGKWQAAPNTQAGPFEWNDIVIILGKVAELAH